MKQRSRPINRKLEAGTYTHDKVVTLRTVFPTANGVPEQSISVPVPLMFRLYHLGRAYDLPRIIGLHPAGMFSIDYVQLQTLGLELELLSGIMDDPALQPHIDAILGIVAATRANTKVRVLFKEE